MKKVVGGGVIGFGLVGFLLCLMTIVSIWSFNREITNRAVDLFDHAEKGILVTGITLNRLIPQIELMQDEYGRHLADVPIEEVATTFHELEALLDSSVANTETAVSAIHLFPVQLFIDLNEDEWKTAVVDLEEITTALDLLANVSISSKEEDTIPANLINIDKQYSQLSEKLKTTIPKISALRKVVFEIKEQLPQWINQISIISTLILVWMGVGQIALIKWGFNRFTDLNTQGN